MTYVFFFFFNMQILCLAIQTDYNSFYIIFHKKLNVCFSYISRSVRVCKEDELFSRGTPSVNSLRNPRGMITSEGGRTALGQI